MTYRGHAVGGLLVGLGAAWGVSANPEAARSHVLAAFGVAFFFSLFPDLDTSSRPQRWFYKLVFFILLFLAWTEQYQMATAVGVLAVLPVLDHHRGWTHHCLSPIMSLLVVAGGHAYWKMEKDGGLAGWMSELRGLTDGIAIQIGCVALAGWYTHLILDGMFKLFPKDDYV